MSVWVPSPLTPTLWQEELEFAVMRIEALKLARQIALASRGRQDPKVRVCSCSVRLVRVVCGPNAFSLTLGQAGLVGVQRRITFQKAKSVTPAYMHTEHVSEIGVGEPGAGGARGVDADSRLGQEG